MLDLLTQVKDRFTAIMAGKLFNDPQGDDREVRCLMLGIDAKRSHVDMGQDYPFLVLRLLGGGDSPGEGLLRVELVGGLYIRPDRDGDGDVDGDDDIVTPATTALSEFVNGFRFLASEGNYSPYSFESMKWRVGDKDGLHPGPDYYEVAAELVFSQAPIF